MKNLSAFQKRLSKLSINTIIVSAGFLFRMLIQALIFFLAARLLGAEEFGLFSAIQALVVLGFPFANWGSGYILIKRVSRRKEQLDLMFGTSVTTTLTMSFVLIIFIILLINLFYSTSIAIRIALPISLGDVIGLAFVTIASQVFQSQGLFEKTSLVWVILSLSRGLFILLFLILPTKDNIQNFALFYGFGGFLGGIVSILWVAFCFGWPKFTLLGMKSEWLQGFYFSISVASQSVYNNVDKTLLSQLATNSVAGIYSVSYRIIDFFTIPIQSLAFILFPDFFRRGEQGINFLYKDFLKILPLSFLIGLFGGIMILFIGPLLPKIFGQEYQLSSLVAVYLSPIIIFRSIHFLTTNMLSGSDNQKLRSIFQVGIATLNIVLNFWLIPHYGIWGTVYSSLISDGILAIGLWIMILYLRNKTNL